MAAASALLFMGAGTLFASALERWQVLAFDASLEKVKVHRARVDVRARDAHFDPVTHAESTPLACAEEDHVLVVKLIEVVADGVLGDHAFDERIVEHDK